VEELAARKASFFPAGKTIMKTQDDLRVLYLQQVNTQDESQQARLGQLHQRLVAGTTPLDGDTWVTEGAAGGGDGGAQGDRTETEDSNDSWVKKERSTSPQDDTGKRQRGFCGGGRPEVAGERVEARGDGGSAFEPRGQCHSLKQRS